MDSTRPRPFRRRVRFSLRALIGMVVVIGCGLGLIARLRRHADLQREAVVAVRKAGGSVLHDWQFEGGQVRVKPGKSIFVKSIIATDVPGWPTWFVDRMGVEYFGEVVHVSFRGGFEPEQYTLSGRKVGEALAYFESRGKLRSVSLLGTWVTDAEVTALLQVQPRLKALYISGAQITDAAIPHLERVPTLESLMLRECQSVTDAALPHIKRLTNLKQLDLAWTQVTNSGLAHLSGLTRLETLDLGHTNISDKGLVHLKGLTNLRYLSLKDTVISNAGLITLLRATPRLKGLDISNTRISDAGLEPVHGMENLTWLCLDGTLVTDRPRLTGLPQRRWGGVAPTHVTLSNLLGLDSSLLHLTPSP